MSLQKTGLVIDATNVDSIKAGLSQINRDAERDPVNQVIAQKMVDARNAGRPDAIISQSDIKLGQIDQAKLAEAKQRAARRAEAQNERERAQGNALDLKDAEIKSTEFHEDYAERSAKGESEDEIAASTAVNARFNQVATEPEVEKTPPVELTFEEKMMKRFDDMERENASLRQQLLRSQLEAKKQSNKMTGEEIAKVVNEDSQDEAFLIQQDGKVQIMPLVNKTFTIGHKRVSDGRGGIREMPNEITLQQGRVTWVERYVFDHLRTCKGVIQGY